MVIKMKIELTDEEFALIKDCLSDRVELMESWGDDPKEVREFIEKLEKKTDGGLYMRTFFIINAARDASDEYAAYLGDNGLIGSEYQTLEAAEAARLKLAELYAVGASVTVGAEHMARFLNNTTVTYVRQSGGKTGESDDT